MPIREKPAKWRAFYFEEARTREWKSVKSELPGDGIPVLVAVHRYGKFKRVCIGQYDAVCRKWYDQEALLRDDYFTSFNNLTGEVTHWQPLPQPPEIFIRHSVVYIEETGEFKGVSVQRYDTKEAYNADVDRMASAFTERRDAVREAKRVARLSKLPYIQEQEEQRNV